MSWNDDRVETLKKLWADGLSCSTIAKELGGVSRNAVIGKVFRLKLSSRATSTRSPYSGKRRKSNGQRASAKSFKRYGVASNVASVASWLDVAVLGDARPAFSKGGRMQVEPFTPTPEIHVPPEERKTLEALEPQHCRYPYGDGPFTFCGRPKHPGLSYCADHARTCSAGAPRPNISRPAKPALPNKFILEDA